MNYVDGWGIKRRLTRTQWHYLQVTDSQGQVRRGWGGYSSTLVVRLLVERGLLRADMRTPEWIITGLTDRGRDLLERSGVAAA